MTWLKLGVGILAMFGMIAGWASAKLLVAIWLHVGL